MVWLRHICDVTFSQICCTRIIYVTHSYMWRKKAPYAWMSFHTWGATHSYAWVTCDVTHSYMWRDSFIHVTWLIQKCDVTHSYMWRDSFTSMARLSHESAACLDARCVSMFIVLFCWYWGKVQPIAFVVSFNLNLQSQSPWSLFDGTWQKRPRELNYRLRFEIEEMKLQMQ